MPSDAEILVSTFEAAMPRIRDAWRRSRQCGHEARMAGKRRCVHARGGNKGMWLRGWDEADEEMARSVRSEA